MPNKTTCISISEAYYKAARKEALERGIRISQIYTEMLKARYGDMQ